MGNSKSEQSVSNAAALVRVEVLMIRCHDAWWRTPGSGAWPFAGDGPWHLMQRSAAQGDYGGEGVDGVSEATRPRTALRVDDVALRDRVTTWLQMVEDPMDRRLVHLVTQAKWRGAAAIPWAKIAKQIGWERTPRALHYRYRKALAVIWCKVEGVPLNRVRNIAA